MVYPQKRLCVLLVFLIRARFLVSLIPEFSPPQAPSAYVLLLTSMLDAGAREGEPALVSAAAPQ
jgi:hypothetical protein